METWQEHALVLLGHAQRECCQSMLAADTDALFYALTEIIQKMKQTSFLPKFVQDQFELFIFQEIVDRMLDNVVDRKRSIFNGKFMVAMDGRARIKFMTCITNLPNRSVVKDSTTTTTRELGLEVLLSKIRKTPLVSRTLFDHDPR